MKLVKPIAIDSDSVLVSSNIAEPDLSTGEVEWVDGANATFFGANPASGTMDVMINGGDGFIYGLADDQIISINIEDDTYSVEATLPVSCYDMCLASNGVIYCLSETTVATYDPSSGAVGSFSGVGGESYICMIEVESGFIHCVQESGTTTGTDGHILIINIADESFEQYGSFSWENNGYITATMIDDKIYAAGYYKNPLVVDTANRTTSQIEAPSSNFYFTSVTVGSYAYFFGKQSKSILKINSISETTSYFAATGGTEQYDTCQFLDDGMVYALSNGIDTPKPLILRLNPETDETYRIEAGQDASIYSSAVTDGAIYCAGASGDSFSKITGLYRAGEQAIKTSTHKIYQAVTTNSDDPEIGVSLAVPSWIEVSATNKYKPFDDVVGTQVESDTGTITYEILPGDIVGGIAGLNLENATSVNVVMNDPTYGEVYNNTLALLDESNVVDAYSYWWSDFKYKTVFTMLDLPSFKNATITVTITGGGTVKAGVIIVGPSFDLGTTLHGTNTKLLDYSTYNEDSFGNITVTKRVPAKLVNFMVSVQSKDDLDDVYEILESMVGEYGLYIGEEENAKEMTTAFGLHRNITLSKDEPTLNKYTLQIRGLT